jgi:hypothetical protein
MGITITNGIEHITRHMLLKAFKRLTREFYGCVESELGPA